MDSETEGEARKIGREAASEMLGAVSDIERSMLADASALYARYANQAAANSRTMGAEKALRKAVTKMATEGVSAYSYTRKDGAVVRVPVDVGVRRAMGTAANQRLLEQTIGICGRSGCGLVEVSTTGNPRPSHAEWEGRIYSLNGTTKDYPDFYSSCRVGDMVNGIGGWNCGHRIAPYREGTPRAYREPEAWDGTTPEERRELVSRQRAMENGIRKQKRVIECLKEAGLTTLEERRRLRLMQGDLQSLVDAHPGLLHRSPGYREGTAPVARKRKGAEGVVHLGEGEKAQVAGSEKAHAQWRDRVTRLGKGCVSVPKQNKHIKGTREYGEKIPASRAKGWPAPSYLTVSAEEAEAMVLEYAGTGEIRHSAGGWSRKEVCRARKVVGYVVTREGREVPTKWFIIHYADDGVHIVPWIEGGRI